MKKQSRDVKLFLVAACASSAIAAGCGSRRQDGWQTCVDQQSRISDERQCDAEASGQGSHQYRWYYYPYGGAPYPIGYGVPLGGRYSAEPFPGVTRAGVGPRTGGAVSGSTVRGGLGSTAAGRSSAG